MLISERIFEELNNQGITQKEFSKRTGIAESTISDWKRKGLNPSSDKIPIICQVLRISAEDLLGITTDYTISTPTLRKKNQNSDNELALSPDEIMLVETYRRIDSDNKTRLEKYAANLRKAIDKGINTTDTISLPGDSPTLAKSHPVNSVESDVNLTICKDLVKRLRKLARLDRIVLDEDAHSSGLNKHLFAYFDYIGVDKLTFIKEYLCNLQPYMITEIKTQEKFDNAICVIDEYYRISIYIKVDATKGEEVIVSFHENNKNGVAKRNFPNPSIDEVYVFADSIGAHVIGTNTYSINLFITRGVHTFPVCIAAHSYDEEGFLVKYSSINNALIEIVNGYLQDLYTSDLDIDSIELFSSTQQLSFTSYGHDVFSNISMLIDSLIIQKNPLSRQVADSALCIYCSSLELNPIDRRDLIDTLAQRFSVNSIRIMPAIIDRITAQLN